MSSLTNTNVAQLARDLITEKAEAEVGLSVITIEQFVGTALSDLSVYIARDPVRRHLLRTDPASTVITFAAGAADLSALIESDNVLLEFIRTAEIQMSSASDYPFQWVGGRAQGSLRSRTDAFFVKVWLEGETLFARDTQGNLDSLTGSASISASRRAAAMADWPEELEEDLIRMVAQIAVNPPAKPQGEAVR